MCGEQVPHQSVEIPHQYFKVFIAAPRSGPLIDQPDALVKGKRGGKRRKKIECLLYDSHQKGKMMIMIMKTPESQVDSPVAEGKRKEGGGRKMRDLHKDT